MKSALQENYPYMAIGGLLGGGSAKVFRRGTFAVASEMRRDSLSFAVAAVSPIRQQLRCLVCFINLVLR